MLYPGDTILSVLLLTIYITDILPFWSCHITQCLSLNFAVLGCEQTTKERLVKLEIITKASDRPDPKDGAGPVSQKSIGRYSRPGSSYVLSLKEADKGEIDSAGKVMLTLE